MNKNRYPDGDSEDADALAETPDAYRSSPLSRTLQRLVGDYTGFFETVLHHLSDVGIDVSDFPTSHLAVRVATGEEYLSTRDRLEQICKANVENVWNGRPISKLLLREPVAIGPDHDLELVELIPPVHDAGYPMGIEHVGFVVGEQFADFRRRHVDIFTGQQDQGAFNQPLFIRFDDDLAVKFHQRSLRDVVVLEGQAFDGFHRSTD